MLSPAEVAQLANVSLKTVYREIDRGALPAVQVGRQHEEERAHILTLLGGPLEPAAAIEREEKRQHRELRRKANRVKLEAALSFDTELIERFLS
jgi:excisionase family DNA binding protein